MKLLRGCALLVLLAAAPALAQPAPKDSADRVTVAATTESAPLVIWNRPIVVFRARVGALSPRDRVSGATNRILTIPDERIQGHVRADFTRMGDVEGYLIIGDDQLAFGLVKEDLDPLGGETLEQAANQAAARLAEVLKARAAQRSLPLLLRGIGLASAATLGLLVVLWFTGRARRRMLAWLDGSTSRSRLQVLEIDLHPHVLHLERRVLILLFWVAWLAVIYVWLTYVFSLFPYTQPWGDAHTGAYLASTASTLASGAAEALPGLVTVLLIFLIARFAARQVSNLFLGVEEGKITVTWLMPETARATRRIVVVLMWLFAIVVAYPYIPGSQTEAFKGIGVMTGLVISIGSAGLVNQIMSGFVVLYSRAVRTGDYVKIGEVEGVITELGVLSAKVVNHRKEEITIPNAVVAGTTTTNYSRLADAQGAIVTTEVTIGYDSPWRQIHALLLLAARRTAGIHPEPRPRVLQKDLADFYVKYVLAFHIDRPELRVPILSELHAQIQDAFNEFGVQIMSPNFEAQPEKAVLVPRSKWYEAPAALPETTHEGASNDRHE